MQAWKMLWTWWLVFSSVAFAAITVVVALKGFGDVRRRLRGIRAQDEKQA